MATFDIILAVWIIVSIPVSFLAAQIIKRAAARYPPTEE